MSPKHSSLAFEETVKEFEGNQFEPQLTVIVNANYAKTPSLFEPTAESDLVQVKGSITVSF